MRGIVYTGEDAVVTDKLEIADPGPTEVKVKIVAAGVCHSDLSVLNGTIPWKDPSVLGHEGAGHRRVGRLGRHLGQARRPRRGGHPRLLRDVPGLQHRPPHHVHQDPRERLHPLHLRR